MKTVKTNTYDLHSPFDIEQHNKHYFNYLEVVIAPNGTVSYAVPSHQEKLISVGMSLFNTDRDSFCKTCPPEYYFDFIQWLCNVTGYISVWTDCCICSNIVTDKQRESLIKLRESGAYIGEIA